MVAAPGFWSVLEDDSRRSKKKKKKSRMFEFGTSVEARGPKTGVVIQALKKLWVTQVRLRVSDSKAEVYLRKTGGRVHS